MAAPKGNQFAKGAGGGRKGYEFESQQLYRMRELWTKFLDLLEKAIDAEGEVDARIVKKLQLLGPDMRKVLDKLHASKTDMTSDGQQVKTFVMPSTIMTKNGITPYTGDSSARQASFSDSPGGETLG